LEKLILLSGSAIRNGQQMYPGVEAALRAAKAAGAVIFLTSNRPEPSWLAEHDYVRFQRTRSRQDGKIVKALLEKNASILRRSDVVVLGATEEDFLMAVNSQTLLLGASWASSYKDKVAEYAIPLSSPGNLNTVLSVLDDKEPWYFVAKTPSYEVFALTDAGTIGKGDLVELRLIRELTDCLKSGAKNLRRGFHLHALSSLYVTAGFEQAKRWSYYPSSASTNEGEEIMATFSNRARVMFKCQGKEPLFVRHTPSVKRHRLGAGADRTNPQSQVESVHLHPYYKNKLRGAHVVVMDDYLTYGLSFGVAAALLRKAGAERVLCVAMGKFGRAALAYEIEILKSPFAPLEPGDYTLKSRTSLVGTTNSDAQESFLKKFGGHV
jgi:hypothetical protein